MLRSWLYYDGVRRIAEVFKDPVLGPAVPIGAGGGSGDVTYTDREYVWGPGYVDECLWQITKPGDVLHVLHDGSRDVVGLLDGTGAVARQYTYDPYGQVIANESFGTVAHNRLGHHGLFFDRLDTNPPVQELVSGAHGLYHNRNRTYDPGTGRFTTRDPNGAGNPIVTFSRLGQVATTDLAAYNTINHYSDGTTVYNYLGGSPIRRTDPLGLFLPGPSDMLSGALEALVDEYSANLDWDTQWASDWDSSDDLHSRLDNSWVDLAMMRGVYGSFEISIPGVDEISFNPLDLFAGASAGRVSQRIIRVDGKVGHCSKRIRIRVASGNYYANKFTHPKYRKQCVILPDTSIRRRVKITPRGNSVSDIAAANKRFGKSGDYDWSDEFGVPHTWHHDHVVGRMYLVPRELHKAVHHVGGARTWYE